MPDGTEIQAHAPDGTIHHFPAGTDPSVVDSTMKQYIANPSGEGTLTKIGRGAALGGFSGLGIPETQTPITDLAKGLNAPKNPLEALDPTGGALVNAVGMLKNLWGAGKEGYQGVQAGDPEQAAHGVSSGLVQTLMLKGAAKAPEAVGAESEVLNAGSGLKEGVRQAGQKLAGVGPELTEAAVRKQGETFGKATEKYQAKAQDYAKNQALTEEAQGHAKELAQHLPELEQKARADAKAAYPKIQGGVDEAAYGQKMAAAAEKLQGSGNVPASLQRIIQDTKPEDLLSQASVFGGAGKSARTPGGVSLDELPAAAREKVMKDLSPEERAVYETKNIQPSGMRSFDDVHGDYSELGKELANKNLAGDERAAIVEARNVASQEMRKLADSEGKLDQFQSAQQQWKQYERTFNKTWTDKTGGASPIAKALMMKDPEGAMVLPEKIMSYLSKNENYTGAQRLLQKYGGKTDVLQAMKEKLDEAKGYPSKSPGEAPVAPGSVDPQALKAESLRKIAEGSTISKPSRFEMWFPPLLLKRRLEGAILNSPKLQEFLSKPSAKDIAKLKASKVYINREAAQK